MAGVDEAAKLMNAVVEKVMRSKTMHVVGRIHTKFAIGAGVFPLSLELAARMEAWYRSPQWRFEASYGSSQWVSVVVEPSEYIHELSPDGRWTRRKSPIGVRPDEAKLKLLGLDLSDIVTYVSLSDASWNGQPVWKVEGRGVGGRRVTWLIDKDDLVVRKVEDDGGFFEFEYRGEKKRAPSPVATVREFEVVEFPAEVPSELFEVPPDAPVEETATDKLLEWLEQWVTEGVGHTKNRES